MKRAAIERPRTVRKWRKHAELIHQGDTSHCLCDTQPGRFRKGQKVAGCNKKGCICKFEKMNKTPTKKVLAANDGYRDQLKDIA